jgi:hypothetical protein
LGLLLLWIGLGGRLSIIRLSLPLILEVGARMSADMAETVLFCCFLWYMVTAVKGCLVSF